VVGEDVSVPLVGGGATRYANLDQAASAPALVAVWQAVNELMPWYSSVHRGTGFKSRVATEAYEAARGPVGQLVGARPDDVVIFTRNTTDAVNLLARCLPEGTTVVTTLAEHHANLLPWRRQGALELPVPASADEALASLELALAALPAGRPALVAATGASNVTGEVWPVGEIAALAHRYGARLFVDAAQLAPHRRVDVAGLGIDWLAFSGHKVYAPFGAGALVGRPDWLASAVPYLLGGGAVGEVGELSATWAALPDRHEGGSPNVVGAVALAAACETLHDVGMDRVAERDKQLAHLLEQTLVAVPGVRVYSTWAGAVDRVAVRAFTVRGYSHAHVAAVLSAEHGIGVRSGSFCAHPLLARLAEGEGSTAGGCSARLPGAVRASLGLGPGEEDLRRLRTALEQLVHEGPRWAYVTGPDGSVQPDPDDRPWPPFAQRAQMGGQAGT
jgi:selenocysteine lyase/cysteine desulfurase